MSIKQEVVEEAIQIIRIELKKNKIFNNTIREQLGIIEKDNKNE